MRSIKKIIPLLLLVVVVAAVFVVAGMYATHAAVVPGSIIQTNDGSTNTGFNLSGNSQSNTGISGTGNFASVGLDISTIATPKQESEYASAFSTCSLKSNGDVFCWGDNTSGRLGDNTTTYRATPVQVHGVGNSGNLSNIVDIDVGFNFACAADTSGNAYCWGAGSVGQLGDSTATSSSVPVRVRGVGGVGDLSNITKISTGADFACAVDTSGNAYCWGSNSSGSLGDNTITQRNFPIQVHGVDNVGSLTGVTRVSAGSSFVCAVKTDGTAYCWGDNYNGKLGDNTTTQRLTPVQVHGNNNSGFLNNVIDISAGSIRGFGSGTTCAADSGGNAYCWGSNLYGSLGINSTTNVYYPTLVHGVGNVGSLSNINSISAGTTHSCATDTSGNAYCWGENAGGMLGNGTGVDSYTPVQVHGVGNVDYLSNVSSINPIGKGSNNSYSRSSGVDSDGTLYFWGEGGNVPVLNSNLKAYQATGTYTSGVLDTGQASDFTTLAWTTSQPSAATSIIFDVQSGTPGTGCADATWNAWDIGVATVTTANATGSATIPSADGRCVRYRAVLAGNTTQTPLLNDVTINYQVSANYNFTLSTSSPNDIVTGVTTPMMVSRITVTVELPMDIPPLTDPVDFTATVSSGGPSLSFSSPSCLPSSGTTCSVDLYALGDALVGSYAVTITGRNGFTRTTLFTLTVTSPMVYTPTLTAYQGEVIKESPTSAYPTPTIIIPLTVTRTGGADEGILAITNNAPAGIIMNPSPPNSAPFGTTFSSNIIFSAQSTVVSGDYTFNIIITPLISGAGNAQSFLFTLKVRDPLNYSLATTDVAAFQGNSITSTVDGLHTSGGTEDVAFPGFSSQTNPLAFSPALTAGRISVSFSGAPCTLGASQPPCVKTMTISNLSNTPVGNYAITIPGVSSSITGQAPTSPLEFTFTVSGPFDFTTAMGAPSAPCSSAACTTEQGTSITVKVDVSSTSPAGERVLVSVNGLDASFSPVVAHAPDPCRPSSLPGTSCTATISISPSLSTPAGTYVFSIVGTSSKQMHSLSYSLTVMQGFTFDVALDTTFGYATRGGAAVNILANINVLSGTAATTVLSVSGLSGSGVIDSFSGGSSCMPNCQRPITLTAQTTAPGCGAGGLDRVCVYNVIITGTHGTQSVQESYTLTVIDPFDFAFSLSSTQGSIMQGGNNAPCVGDNVLNSITGKCDKATVATLSWVAGGSGTEVISLDASVIPSPSPVLTKDIVSFNAPFITGLATSTTPLYSTITLTATSTPDMLVSDSYTIIFIARSGTLVKTKTYMLIVGTTLEFSLALVPDNERVMQGASSAPVLITATNVSDQDQLTTNNILFTIGDTSKYQLPKDVTVTPSSIAPCVLGAVIGSTCASSFVFNVGPTAIDETYLIPIMAKSGPVRSVINYTLKIGPLTLVDFKSPDFMTDGHERPQVSFTWSSPAIFAGDTIQLDAAASTVHVAESDLSASTSAIGNASFSWTIPGMAAPSSISNPFVQFTGSGKFNASLLVTDSTGNVCFKGDSSPEACWCEVSASMMTGSPLDVSKQRPSFKEVKPQ